MMIKLLLPLMIIITNIINIIMINMINIVNIITIIQMIGRASAGDVRAGRPRPAGGGETNVDVRISDRR